MFPPHELSVILMTPLSVKDLVRELTLEGIFKCNSSSKIVVFNINIFLACFSSFSFFFFFSEVQIVS